MTGLLFLCVANSARSQIAEGLARALAPEGIEVFSAGSAPGRIHPLAVRVLEEVGIDASDQRSKGLDEVPLDRIRTVVTLCAEEECPILPGRIDRRHWGLPDPAGVRGSEEEQLAAFRAVREELRARLPELLAELARTR